MMSLRHPVMPRQASLPIAPPAPPDGYPPMASMATPSRLWLALHFTQLALDLVTPLERPFVVHENDTRRREIHLMNRAARALGITRGMPLAAAFGLCGELLTRPRDAAEEQRALANLGAWALQYTDHVSLVAPDALLLEIGGSLRLFGGLDSLRTRIRDDLVGIGHRPRAGIAPVPSGAMLLARAGIGTPAHDLDTLAQVLRALPLGLLQQSSSVTHALHGLGVATLGELMRLPRAGLARRLGPGLLLQLDRLLGRHPDPQPRFEPPPYFSQTLWLAAATTDAERLRQALHRLLSELSGVLRGRGAGVQELGIELLHAKGSAERIELGLLTPTRETRHWLDLLAERLARHRLGAPVEGLRLHASRFIALPHVDGELFIRQGTTPADWRPLVERLRARLGHDAVHGVQAVDEHRPERAWRPVEPGTTHAATRLPPAGTRPLWLLARPLPTPRHLQYETPPERIESGWWDGDDRGRDYRIARNARGERLWLYRKTGEGEAELVQGIFS